MEYINFEFLNLNRLDFKQIEDQQDEIYELTYDINDKPLVVSM